MTRFERRMRENSWKVRLKGNKYIVKFEFMTFCTTYFQCHIKLAI